MLYYDICISIVNGTKVLQIIHNINILRLLFRNYDHAKNFDTLMLGYCNISSKL